MAGGVRSGQQRPYPGFLITFEGPEGSGKSVQSQALARFLEEQGYPVVWTREPGGTPLGQQVRGMIFQHSQQLDPWAEVFLFLADRAQHTAQVLLPALQQGRVVICDRFTDSTLAYQGFGRGLDLKYLRKLNLLATQGLQPDLTILLDIEVEAGLQRRAHSREWNHFDARQLEFHRRVRQGYLQLAREEPRRWVVVSGQGDKDQVQQRIREAVLQRLSVRVG